MNKSVSSDSAYRSRNDRCKAKGQRKVHVLWVALLLAHGHGCARRVVAPESDAHDDNRDALSDQQAPPAQKTSPARAVEPADGGFFWGRRRIQLRVATPMSSGAAVIDFEAPTSWDPNCMLHRPCPLMPRTLRDCAANVKRGAQSHFDVPELKLRGRLVKAKGTLVVGDGHATLGWCAPTTCCNRLYATVVVLTESDVIELDGLACGGDDSRICCNAPAFGQAVIAMGRLMLNDSSLNARWKLVDAELCLDN